MSFVALGADDNTEARVAAGQAEDDPDTGDEETSDDLEPVNASLAMSTKPKAKPQSQPLSAVDQMRAEAAAGGCGMASSRPPEGGSMPPEGGRGDMDQRSSTDSASIRTAW